MPEDEKSDSRPMGCTMYSIVRKKTKKNIPLVTILIPPLRVPVQYYDLQNVLSGLIPREDADRICVLRNQIVLLAEETGKMVHFFSFFIRPDEIN